MKRNSKSVMWRLFADQRGQVLPIVAVMMTVMLGMIGFVVDVGDVYAGYNQLQESTDAAALAGATALPASTAVATATLYSSAPGGKNVSSLLGTVTMVSGYPLVRCLTSLASSCPSPAYGNAIQVKQQAAVPMYFARLFGIKSITISTSSMASMNGSTPKPYNVAMIIDTTLSQTNTDDNCGTTEITCELNGVLTLLQGLYPARRTKQAARSPATPQPTR